MHSSTPSSSSSITTTTTNIEQYHYPPISTLRRASRPGNINLSLFDQNNTQLSNDPAIYSAPICYIKQPSDHQQHIQQQQPYTATFQYQQQQHIQLPVQNHNIQICQQPQQQQQQQQPLMDPYSQHTPHTFPLQGSPNHYHQYFYFPPSTLQGDVTTNGHQTASAHNNRLRAVQIQEQQQQQQQWSNPVLSPLMVKRMNENVASMSMDDDEDPSASIDALVADVDSSPHDLLDDQQNKSMDESKTTSITSAGTISPSPHIYLRSTSHILTTPPNPLASDDHPDNQLTVGNNFQKTFSPIPSAGFELTAKKSSSTNGTSYFTFDANNSESTVLKINEEDKSTKPHTDVRTSKSLIQDENSNQSSTNSSGHNTSSRIYSQMLQTSEQQRLSSSSPLSNDIKLSPLDADHNQSTVQNRHYCAHPDCNKIFANKSALAKHKLTHSQDRKHKCSKCNKVFKRLDHLHGHMLTHEEEKPHKCRVPNCNRTYCDARSLKRHIDNVHQDILAAIYEGKHDEYRLFLPETAVVKTKDLSINSEFSIDSVDSNSPHSLNDNEQAFHIRTANGTKIMTTYTYDEEKCVECQICKKPFKNGAALNGHMRLHGGFNEKQPSPSSTDNIQKKKRAPVPKRKRIDSPSTSVSIKTEKQDVPMISSLNDIYSSSSFTNLPPCSDVLQSHFHDQTLSSRARSASSSFLPNSSTSFTQYTIKNPMSVQPSVKQSRMTQFNPMTNSPILSTSHQQYDDKSRKSFSSENNRQMNGMPSPYTYGRTLPHQNLSLPSYQINSTPSNSLSTNLLQHLFRQRGDMLNQDFYLQHPPNSSFDELTRYTPSPNFGHSPIPNSTSMINTPVASPYTSHTSPVSTSQTSNNHQIINNGMQPSPTTHSTSSSSCSSSSSSHTAPKKRILNAMKQGTQDEKQAPPVIEERPPSPAVLEIVPDIDSPVKKHLSGFLIGTPSSTGASSSSSTSSHTHFNYEEVPPPKKRDSTPSSFQWPSQFRRQLSLNIANPTLNPVPSTPYTPPPMLSPFRKGPGLYYRVFSHPGPSTDPSSIPTTPINDESASPKINIGRDYQAIIPKLRTDQNDDDVGDELLFSPFELTSFDEKSLEKFEQLNRINPFLFSPRHSPTSYPLELVYMLLYEYNGDLQRTLAALLEGTAKDIKQCRPIHRYRFPECDKWTQEEIDAFTKAIQSSEKNFELVSRTVGTKTIKQCIEFHYMPKVNLTSRKIYPKATSSVITRRKRFQMIRAKQQLEDETSSSSFNEFRFDDDSSTRNSDSPSTAQFSCDIDECSQTFTTDRACRAHRKEHRRIVNNNMTTSKTKSSC
jgi:hypothetical protein